MDSILPMRLRGMKHNRIGAGHHAVRILAGVALAVLVSVSTQPAFGRPALLAPSWLRARWEQVNRTSLARVTPPAKRAVQQRLFKETLARLRAGRDQVGLTLAHDPRTIARVELSIPGRYQLRRKLQSVSPAPWWLHAWHRFLRWLQQVWNSLTRGIHPGVATRVSVGMLIAIAAVVLVLSVVLRLLLTQLRPLSKLPHTADSLESVDPNLAYRRAEAMAQANDFAAAVRGLFVAAVAALDMRGTISAQAGTTVRDVRLRLRRESAALGDCFDPLAEVYVAAAYMERPIVAQDWERARMAFKQTLSGGAAP
ncbi:MAG: DUF4129 domain-containing protein [Bacillati bacterium]